jgi:hypothetical protein
MADPDTRALEKRMNGAVEALRREFAGLRTGRASASLLEPITVDAYGSAMPINQVGTIGVPEPRLITVQILDRSLVNAVERAIRDAGLGLNGYDNLQRKYVTVWVDTLGTGIFVMEGTASPDGETITLAATRDLRIRAGNAGAVQLTINGIGIGPMGGNGQVIEWRITRTGS